MAKELTDHDMITKMYTELMGLSGENGMIKEHQIMKKDVNSLKQYVAVRSTIWPRVKDVVIVIGIIISIAIGLGAFK